ncbi:MAG: DUF4062 domain-containing protein [Euryhalocaulis sp.]|uniref:DUF4062 domain-containing protein n=1 Tax=Euryhalocaulis sp. TaxID=2744307 RepID=UPI001825E0A2|nr:DUF4062 domain-containing protein [Euryhalocaulis sp.]MBA4801600.1 DUF4062 domain-containing protein [Euryhalocaulis sp.]
MDKRYQVFVSSTFADLIDERKAIQEAILSLDHFPAGMELFPASDDDQWQLIKSVIDDSDYYIIVVGGRYGSLNAEGISYTEMEFEYAIENQIPVLAFVHENPNAIPSGKTDQNDESRKKLDEFRAKVCDGRHVKFWKDRETLRAVVLQALVTETKKNPREGWVRASQASDPAALARLRDELAELKRSGPPADVESLQHGADKVILTIEPNRYASQGREHVVESTWDEIFSNAAPTLLQEASESSFKSRICAFAESEKDVQGRSAQLGLRPQIKNEDFDKIKIQLVALNLIQKGQTKRSATDKNVYWGLTDYGEEYLMKLRAMKR